jgi:hypothetical protein
MDKMYGPNHNGRSLLLGNLLCGFGLRSRYLLALVALTWSAFAQAGDIYWFAHGLEGNKYFTEKDASAVYNCTENLDGYGLTFDRWEDNWQSGNTHYLYCYGVGVTGAYSGVTKYYECGATTPFFDPSTNTCTAEPPPVDCSAQPRMIKQSAGGTAVPHTFVGPDGCEYGPEYKDDGSRDYWCDYTYGTTDLVCTFPYAPTGNEGTPTPFAPDVTESEDPNPGDFNEEEPTTTEENTTPPVTSPDTPGPGDTTTEQTKTETTNDPGGKSVTNTSTEVTATQEGDFVKTTTTTTTTTTYADGTTTTTENTSTTVTKAPSTSTTINADGTAVTTTTDPGYTRTGGTSTTTTTGADGSSSTTTSTSGIGDGADETNGEDEGEEDAPFTGPETGGQPTAEETGAELWNKLNAAPIVAAVNGLGGVSNPTGSCTAFTVPAGWIFGTFSTTIHCDIWDTASPALGLIMMVAWSWLALVIFLRA